MALSQYDENGDLIEAPVNEGAPVETLAPKKTSKLTEYDSNGNPLNADGVSTPAPVLEKPPKEEQGMFSSIGDWISETADLTGEMLQTQGEGLLAGASEYGGRDKELSRYQKQKAAKQARETLELGSKMSTAQNLTAGGLTTLPLIAGTALTRSPAVAGALTGTLQTMGDVFSEQARRGEDLNLTSAAQGGGGELLANAAINALPGGRAASTLGRVARNVAEDATMGAAGQVAFNQGVGDDLSNDLGTAAVMGGVVGQGMRVGADMAPKVVSKIKQIPELTKELDARTMATNAGAVATDAARKAYERTSNVIRRNGKAETSSPLADQTRAYMDTNAQYDTVIRESNDQLSDPNISDGRRRELDEDIRNASASKVANDVQYGPTKASVDILSNAPDGVITQDMLDVSITKPDGTEGKLSDYFEGIDDSSMKKAAARVDSALPGVVLGGSSTKANIRQPQFKFLDKEIATVDATFNNMSTALEMRIRDRADAGATDTEMKRLKTLLTDIRGLHRDAGQEAKPAGGATESMRLRAERIEENTQFLGETIDDIVTNKSGERINFYSEAMKIPLARAMKQATSIDSVKVRSPSDELADTRRQMADSPGTYLSAGAAPILKSIGRMAGRGLARKEKATGNTIRDQATQAQQIEAGVKSGSPEVAADIATAGLEASGINTSVGLSRTPAPVKAQVPEVDPISDVPLTDVEPVVDRTTAEVEADQKTMEDNQKQVVKMAEQVSAVEKEVPVVQKVPDTMAKAKPDPYVAPETEPTKAKDEPLITDDEAVALKEVTSDTEAPISDSKPSKPKSEPIGPTKPKQVQKGSTGAPRAKVSPATERIRIDQQQLILGKVKDIAAVRKSDISDSEIMDIIKDMTVDGKVPTRQEVGDRVTSIIKEQDKTRSAAAKNRAKADTTKILSTKETPEAATLRKAQEKAAAEKAVHDATNAQINLAISRNKVFQDADIMDEAWNVAITKGVNPEKLVKGDVAKLFGAAQSITDKRLKVATDLAKKATADSEVEAVLQSRESDRVQRADDNATKLAEYAKQQELNREASITKAKAVASGKVKSAKIKADTELKKIMNKRLDKAKEAKEKARIEQDKLETEAAAKLELSKVQDKAKIDKANDEAAKLSADRALRDEQTEWYDTLPDKYGFTNRSDQFTVDLDNAINKRLKQKHADPDTPLTPQEEGYIVGMVEDMIHKEWRSLKVKAKDIATKEKAAKSEVAKQYERDQLAKVNKNLDKVNESLADISKDKAKQLEKDLAKTETVKGIEKNLSKLVSQKTEADRMAQKANRIEQQRTSFEQELRDRNYGDEFIQYASDKRFTGVTEPVDERLIRKELMHDYSDFTKAQEIRASERSNEIEEANANLKAQIDEILSDPLQSLQAQVDTLKGVNESLAEQVANIKKNPGNAKAVNANLDTVSKAAKTAAKASESNPKQSQGFKAVSTTADALKAVNTRKSKYPENPELWVSTDMKANILIALGRDPGSTQYGGHYQDLRQAAFGDIGDSARKKNVRFSEEEIAKHTAALDKDPNYTVPGTDESFKKDLAKEIVDEQERRAKKGKKGKDDPDPEPEPDPTPTPPAPKKKAEKPTPKKKAEKSTPAPTPEVEKPEVRDGALSSTDVSEVGDASTESVDKIEASEARIAKIRDAVEGIQDGSPMKKAKIVDGFQSVDYKKPVDIGNGEFIVKIEQDGFNSYTGERSEDKLWKAYDEKGNVVADSRNKAGIIKEVEKLRK